jgi:large subunit ribosomal protein L3
MKMIIGKKIGMVTWFTEEGKAVPVSVLETSNVVVSKFIDIGKENEIRVEIGKDKEARSKKPDIGNYKSLGFVPLVKFNLKLSTNLINNKKIGDVLDVDQFSVGDTVVVTGITKGKGFAGVVKRHKMKGGPRTHGQSDRERAIGAIGCRTIPGRVFKGKRMAGHMGVTKKTIKGLRVVSKDIDKKLLFVSGSVPGPKGAYVLVRSY